MPTATLKVNDFALPIHLGWTEKERAMVQLVTIVLQFDFSVLPRGCIDDDLANTICYDVLTEQIAAYCTARSFKLLEALAYQIYQLVKAKIPQNIRLTITVSKNPPLDKVQQAAFTISDE